MNLTVGETPRSRYSLPASLIFSPRELKQYRRWQSLHSAMKPSEYGLLPTAFQYDDFQQWLKKQDSGYFSDVFDDIYEHIQSPSSPSEPTIATLCRHNIHPVAMSESQLRCPVCTIDIHLSYMKALTLSLHKVNGRPLPFTGTPSEQQENLYLAWSQGKMSTLREVCALETSSAKEAEWSDSRPQEEVEDVHSATKALGLYWFEVAGCESKQTRSTTTKKVVFAEDTNFSPSRPTDYFLRRSPRYEPGKHTVTYEEGEDDDVSEDSEDYVGARILILGGLEDAAPDDGNAVPTESECSDHYLDGLDFDDGDSDWEDIDSDEGEDESDTGSYICFEDDDGST